MYILLTLPRTLFEKHCLIQTNSFDARSGRNWGVKTKIVIHILKENSFLIRIVYIIRSKQTGGEGGHSGPKLDFYCNSTEVGMLYILSNLLAR